MKLPYKVKDTKSIQRNFDYLSSALGFHKASDIRSMSPSVTGGGVAAGYPVNTAGFQKVTGIIVCEMSPAGHFNFFWDPRPSIGDIAIWNNGVTQVINISYIILGS